MRQILVVLCALWVVGATGPAAAEGFRFDSISIFGGPSFGGDEDLAQIDLIARFETPWRWEGDRWAAWVGLEITGGVITGADTAFVASAGPTLGLRRTSWPAYVEIGVSPTLLTDTTYGDKDMGGIFQFTSHAALGVLLGEGERVRLGYRIQHTSSAGISSPNPGLNVHGLELGLRF